MRKNIAWTVLIIYFFPFILTFGGFFFQSAIAHADLMNPFGRDYRLTGTTVSVVIEEDGLVSLNENIGYHLKGCFNELYRVTDIGQKYYYGTLTRSPYLIDAQGSCGEGGVFEDRTYELACKLSQRCDTNIDFNIQADIGNGIIIGNDVAEFHYKIWGDRWDKKLKKLDAKVVLPKGTDMSKVQVFFAPRGIVDNSRIEGNIIYLDAKNLYHQYVEIRVIMPKDTFSSQHNTFYQTNPLLLREDILFQEKEYDRKLKENTKISLAIYIAFALAIILFPLIIFFALGKEPKISYNGIFEREPIKDLKPYIINSLCMGKTGDTNPDAIVATLFDLVRRKHIVLKAYKLAGKKKSEVVLEFTGKPKDKLTAPEQKVYDYFLKQSYSNTLNWKHFTKTLKKYDKAVEYMKFVKKFEKLVDKEYDLKKYFDNKGTILFRIFCGIIIALGIWATTYLYSLGSTTLYPILKYAWLLAAGSIVFGIIGFCLSDRIFGRYTKEGYEIYMKSINFKKFMTDMTLLKKYPPASIIIWDEILVYAIMFGVAKKVLKHMKLHVPNQMQTKSNLYPLYTYSTFSTINRTYSVAASHSVRSSSGSGGFNGGGGFSGGGFGGGGGGAR